jgi:lipase
MALFLAVAAVAFVHGLIGRFSDPRALSSLGLGRFVAPDLHGYGRRADDSIDGLTIGNQVDSLHEAICREVDLNEPVHLVGHSVGGVIAAAYAYQYPERIASVVDVEGNFTLDDAFWSRKIALQSATSVERLIAAFKSDPATWLCDAGVEPTEERIRAAEEALSYQPSSTVQATARAVVEFTGSPAYDEMLRTVFNRVPVHLVAGTRSRDGWHVPDWALEAAESYSEIHDSGHMIMLEAPEEFGSCLRRLIDPHHINQ